MASAQEAYGGYSPYSIFGVGDLAVQGSAYNKSMGGVGIAGRNNRYLNIMNPAAVTARDSLSFMASFSMNVNNKIFRQGDALSANNVVNVNDVVISFPIQRASAMMLGIVPYSNTGFEFGGRYTDPGLVGTAGDIFYSADGIGSMYKLFAAAGVTFLKRISLGAELDYYFGNITKNFTTSFSDSSYSSISNKNVLQLTGIGGRFGLQYEQPFGDDVSMVVGATYTTGAKLRGYYENSRMSVGSVTTGHHRNHQACRPCRRDRGRRIVEEGQQMARGVQLYTFRLEEFGNGEHQRLQPVFNTFQRFHHGGVQARFRIHPQSD